MKLSRLLSALLLLTAAFAIASCGLSVQELAAQQSGTISIIIGGSNTSTTTASSTHHGGGGGWVSCTSVPGGITCVYTPVTTLTSGGGGDGGSSTTVLTTQASSPYTDSGGGNTTATSTTTSMPELHSVPVVLVSAIGLVLVTCRSLLRRKRVRPAGRKIRFELLIYKRGFWRDGSDMGRRSHLQFTVTDKLPRRES